MSQSVITEALFAVRCMGIGILITVCYDILRISRRVVRHSYFMISLEDFLFWVICAIFLFFILNMENDGILRWYLAAFAGIGMQIYLKTISPYFVDFMSTALSKTIHLVFTVFKWLGRPCKCVFSWFRGKGRKICHIFTKKRKEWNK